jgi:predicted O-methyltransferase YrrM
MSQEYRSPDWNEYVMDYVKPHLALEPLETEIAIVDDVLNLFAEVGILPHTKYDHGKMLAHRKAVAESFEIPWTAITPRMERLLYAISAIIQPENMIAAGVFCGVTFISNAGAGVGPGACYTAKNLIGVEILPEEAERAERNVRRIDPSGIARIVSEDAVGTVTNFPEPIQVLYLDADDGTDRGKGIYLEIVQACYDKLPTGSVVLAHNSVNFAERLESYLTFARDPANFSESVNVIFDIEGLEVSVR